MVLQLFVYLISEGFSRSKPMSNFYLSAKRLLEG